jgi:hypothetical protein
MALSDAILDLTPGDRGQAGVSPIDQDGWAIDSYPLHLYLFGEGLYVVGGRYPTLVGAEVVLIGGMRTSLALQKLREVIGFDTSTTAKVRLPYFSVLKDFLHGLRLHENARPFTLRMPNGEIVNPKVEATPLEEFLGDGPYLTFPVGLPRSPRGPLYLRRKWDPLWRTRLGDVAFVQYNSFEADSRGVARKLERTKSGLTGLIVDLRHSAGGPPEMARPISRWIERNGDIRVALLIGRDTLSQAASFAARLRSRSNVVLIGEQSGSRDYWRSSPITFTLPFTDIRVSLGGEIDRPRSTPVTIDPDVEVALRAGDFFSRSDPVLDAAMEGF